MIPCGKILAGTPPSQLPFRKSMNSVNLMAYIFLLDPPQFKCHFFNLQNYGFLSSLLRSFSRFLASTGAFAIVNCSFEILNIGITTQLDKKRINMKFSGKGYVLVIDLMTEFVAVMNEAL